jgi:hypothetical protein
MIGRTVANLKIANPINIRGTLSYNLKQKKTLTSSNEAIDYRFLNGTTANLNHTYQFPVNSQKSSNNYSLNINKPFEKYILGIGLSYLTTSLGNSYEASLNLFTSFGYDAKYKSGLITGTPMTNNGVISARVFLDENANDSYDDKEELLSGIKVYAEGSALTKTNENGIAIIPGIAVNMPVKVGIEEGSLVDPSWMAKKSVFNIISHAGAITNIDFPISLTGDIDGHIKIKINKLSYDASNVELEIVNAKGTVIRSTKSSYDGFYFFQAVPYGKYKLRTSVEQSQRLGLESSVTYDIEVNSSFQALSGFDFLIEKNKPEELVPTAQ